MWLATAPPAASFAPPPTDPAGPVRPPADATPVPPVAAPIEPAPITPPSEPAPSSLPAAPPAAPPGTPPAESEVVVTGRSRTGDPLQSVNVATFDATQGIDRAVVGPVAKAYQKGIPKPLRKGLRNFLNNLREPVVFVNYLLQLKPGKAAETAGRFALNTTIGIGGVVDVAKRKPFWLPRRRNGFANTLGFYGVKPGPFFFLPLIGPTTLRDLVGNFTDQFVPIGPIRPLSGSKYTIPVAILSALDYRAEFDDELERQRATADPYAAARRFYLERRQAEIDALRGRKRAPRPVATPATVPESPAEATRPVIGPPA